MIRTTTTKILTILIALSVIGCGLNQQDELEEYWISPNTLPFFTEADMDNLSMLHQQLPEENGRLLTEGFPASYETVKKYGQLNNKDLRFINAHKQSNTYLKLDPQPGTTIPENRVITITFEQPMQSVIVNKIPAWGIAEHWETKPERPVDHPVNEPIYLVIEYTLKDGGYTGSKVVYPYHLTTGDYSAPEITHSTIANNATNINQNTSEIKVTFNEPIKRGSISLHESSKNLDWEQGIADNTAYLYELTESDIKEQVNQTSVPGYKIRGSGQHTKVINTTEPTVHGLAPSHTIEGNKRYEIRIIAEDYAGNTSRHTITFSTGAQ